MNPAARRGDHHTCPMMNPDESPHTGGPIAEGEETVLIGDAPAARRGDRATCLGPTDSIATGNESVLVGGRPVVALGDLTEHGGFVEEGELTVLVGDPSAGAGGATGATMRAARREGRPLCELCSEGQGEP